MPLEPQDCTVGVIAIPDGMLFFKNRDLPGVIRKDTTATYHTTSDIHALRGVNFQSVALDGISIGVNRWGVCVANTHILTTDGVTYDVLCERLLGARRRDDVLRIVEDFMAGRTMQGGRILVASPRWAFLVEVLREQFEIQEVHPALAITNTFSLIDHDPERPASRESSSLTRLRMATQMMAGILDLDGLQQMLRSHVPEKGELSICNHRPDGGGTESSHIVRVQGDDIEWLSLIGAPCENTYRTSRPFAEN